MVSRTDIRKAIDNNIDVVRVLQSTSSEGGTTTTNDNNGTVVSAVLKKLETARSSNIT